MPLLAEGLAWKVLDSFQQGVLVTDRENRIVAVNPAFTEITGYTRGEVLGQNPSLLSSGQNPPDFYPRLWAELEERGTWSGEIVNRGRNGQLFVEWMTIATIRDAEGDVAFRTATFSDITDQKEEDCRAWKQAHHDPLTGLPNRKLFMQRLAGLIEQARGSGGTFAVLFVDLDHFKWVNDRLGHDAGDELLRAVAQRLQRVAAPPNVVARMGGDEFTLILEAAPEETAATALTEKLVQTMARPFQVQGQEIFISCSIGMSLFPEHGDLPDELLRSADRALHQVKETGRGAVTRYDAGLENKIDRRAALASDLRRAHSRDELRLVFQPIVDLRTRATVGVEALARWMHPELGAICPRTFIRVAEESGLIGELGRWSLREASRAAARWQEAGLAGVPVSVNVTGRQLIGLEFAGQVEQTLAETGLEPGLLELELTESALAEDARCSLASLRRLRGMGIALGLDDFGTGYSSLSYLGRFPVSKIKVDSSFLQAAPSDAATALVTRAMVGMAHGLGLRVVAEGIATRQQLDFAVAEGFDLAQGYFLGPPMCLEELLRWHGAAGASSGPGDTPMDRPSPGDAGEAPEPGGLVAPPPPG